MIRLLSDWLIAGKVSAYGGLDRSGLNYTENACRTIMILFLESLTSNGFLITILSLKVFQRVEY